MQQQSASQLFEAFNSVRVLILGDVMIDRYLVGSVDRISPEAPVPVVRLKTSENRLGGAANVALNLKSLGAQPVLCSVIGEDESGARFKELLPQHGIESSYLYTSPQRKTTVKTRVLASNQQLLRVDQEDTYELTEAEHAAYWTLLERTIRDTKIDLILFQDYNKGVLTANIIKRTLQLAQELAIPTAVDPKFKHFWAYEGVSLFKPNLKEIAEQLPFDFEANLEELQSVAAYIRKQLGNEAALITLSEKGLFIENQSENLLIGTQPRAIVDVCGAGDAVISVAAVALALKCSLEVIAQLANLAGGQVCERVGVVPINKPQLLEEYENLLAST